jgi:hypothetical protein
LFEAEIFENTDVASFDETVVGPRVTPSQQQFYIIATKGLLMYYSTARSFAASA